MKRTFGCFVLVFFVFVGFSLCYGAVADDLAAKKDMKVVLQNALLAGMNWETAVFETIKAGADARQVIETALLMNGDPQGIIRGAKAAGVDEKTIRDALASVYARSDNFGGRSDQAPLSPILPTYSGGGGGGGGRPAASPFR